MNNIFVECFGQLEDKRYKNKQHLLLDIISIVLCGVLSGMKDFGEIQMFAEAHEEWFKKHLLLPNGIPSHDTMGRVLSMLNPEHFADCFISWVKKVKKLLNEDVVAIDGKTLCGSSEKTNGIKAVHLVNAYSCVNGITLKQVKVDDKSNEITAIPEIINTLALQGAIITIDAMGCQKNIAESIVNAQADYVLAVKGNHKELHVPIIDVFNLSKNPNFNRKLKPSIYEHEIDCEHGKIENRIVRGLPINSISNELDLSGWKNSKSIIQIEHINHTNNTTEFRYYISTIPYLEIEKIARAIRSHWQVENNLHWVLDMTFKEDESRIRDKIVAQNMSWIRKMSAYLLKQVSSKLSMKNKMIKNCINPNNLLQCFEMI